eukprot:CAMPEP_0179263738 /NCGR_PEP_ID=MMETSP0797-20121207/28033_1 /TAXON_ID=47934 /ORGANISM="Dinophysis acuminata, Strain DAEP01" /LENGTH=239 /DNA_ID=CAMNT_0020971905 /DNA_START=36 /DNA_END=756 /DNA_ORIENTATION=-
MKAGVAADSGRGSVSVQPEKQLLDVPPVGLQEDVQVDRPRGPLEPRHAGRDLLDGEEAVPVVHEVEQLVAVAEHLHGGAARHREAAGAAVAAHGVRGRHLRVLGDRVVDLLLLRGAHRLGQVPPLAEAVPHGVDLPLVLDVLPRLERRVEEAAGTMIILNGVLLLSSHTAPPHLAQLFRQDMAPSLYGKDSKSPVTVTLSAGYSLAAWLTPPPHLRQSSQWQNSCMAGLPVTVTVHAPQ